ncbi:MAG: 30S ribosomal protein S17 [Kiloniellales bacterium]|nr:30S ribosomal protein S17 [Kiloniellales bacterium]
MTERRQMTGFVTSDKMDKTVVVETTRSFLHPLYGKVVHSKKKLKAHDEMGSRVGDQVRLIESRPISKTKRWVVVEIMRRGVGSGETVMEEIIDDPA